MFGIIIQKIDIGVFDETLLYLLLKLRCYDKTPSNKEIYTKTQYQK